MFNAQVTQLQRKTQLRSLSYLIVFNAQPTELQRKTQQRSLLVVSVQRPANPYPKKDEATHALVS